MVILNILPILFAVLPIALSQCPPLNQHCSCSPITEESSLEKLKIICDGISLLDATTYLKTINQPMDLTIQNGHFPVLSADYFQGLTIGKLALITNDVEKITAGVFKNSGNLRELFIKDAALQVIDDTAFGDLKHLQNISIYNAHSLERIPKFREFSELTNVAFVNNSIRFLEASFLSKLPKLKEINLRNNQIEIFDMRTFDELPAVTKLDISGNQLNDISFLPLILRSLPALNLLFLQQNKIQRVPDGFLDGLTSILLIDLRNNQINKLPDRLLSLATTDTPVTSTLREIYLGNNYINDIPPNCFSNVLGLKTLSLANNSINVLNKQLNPLKDLLYLRLEGNRLQRITNEAFATLTRVQIISLENNHLTVLENGLFTNNLALQTLDLSRNYLQEFRGTEIKNLPKLENLLLGGNKLRNLYAGFDSLVELRRLDLSNNQISNIDDNTFINLKNLEYLQLDGNLFMKVPLTALTQLPVLERLTLSNNRIHFLTEFTPIGRLKYLALDHNILQNLDANVFNQLANLRQLLLNDNMISVIDPGAFNNMYTLYVLDLSGNVMDTIQPKVFDNLVSLESLDLSNNEMEQLNDGTLGNLPSLRSVDFSQNRINTVLNSAFVNLPHLVQFNISRNQLNMIPESIMKLSKLRKLDLSSNKIKRVEDGIFTNQPLLENLFLQKNPLCYLGSKAFIALIKLSYLDLSNTGLRHIPQSAFPIGQDFSTINLEGVTVECDCSIKWLIPMKPDIKCGYPGAVSAGKISQINPNTLTCSPDTSDEECPVEKLTTRPPRNYGQPGMVGVTAVTEQPTEEVLAKGSATQAWLTQNEHEQKVEELAAIQAAKQTRNGGVAVMIKGGSEWTRGLLVAVVLMIIRMVER